MAAAEFCNPELKLRPITLKERLEKWWILNVKGGNLSDRTMRQFIETGYIGFQSPLPVKYQPASIDMHLGPNLVFLDVRDLGHPLMDIREPMDRYVRRERIGEGLYLHPGQFALGITAEAVRIPKDMLGSVEGKSSLGRMGTFVHVTAGFIDPEFEGHVTLELFNALGTSIRLEPYMPFAQI